jgi:hypothetical protein
MPNLPSIIYDDKNDIVHFKAYEFFGLLLESAIQDNGEGERILSKSGISSMAEHYKPQLTPHSYNGQWKNENVRFNPVAVFLELFPRLDSEHKFLLIQNIVEMVPHWAIKKEELKNYLSFLGYSLVEDYNCRSKYTIAQTTVGMIERGEDVSRLEQKIKNDFPNEYRHYNEAISTFGNGEYKSCIDNCRSLFEAITKTVGGASTDKAILNITKEFVIDDTNTQLTSKDKIYKHWLDKRKGANRYRYFTTLYSVMSGLGTHGEDVPTREDAVLLLRAMEDALVWILKI